MEMSAKEVPKPSELPEGRGQRYETNADPAPQEMDAGVDGEGTGAGGDGGGGRVLLEGVRDEKSPL